MGYDICTDYFEIVSGERNPYGRLYIEAAKEAENGDPKGLGKMNKIVADIENIANKVKDPAISASRGDIEQFSGYQNITHSMNFIKTHVPGSSDLLHITSLLNSLKNDKELYKEGYNKNITLITLEYENAVYLLVSGLTMIMCSNIDFETRDGKIKIIKKSGKTHGITSKCIREYAKELNSSKHKEYLQTVIKTAEAKKSGKLNNINSQESNMNESTYYTEASFGEIVGCIFRMIPLGIGTIKNLFGFGKRMFIGARQTLFGILPLIRSVLYMRYRKKANKIAALEEQCRFIEENIEHLQNNESMDPAKKKVIIMKQQAYIEKYKKKAEKLRAQLCEEEKEAAMSSSDSNKEIQKPSTQEEDDDLVLEYIGIDPAVFK